MGTEAVWVPLALTALAAGGQYYNTQQTAKRQDNTLASQLRNQAETQREADARVSDLIAQRGESSSEGERTGTLNQYLAQARQAQGAANAGFSQSGAVSDAYRQASNDAAMGVSDYAAKTADLMSRMDAPVLQRQREALDGARFETDLNQIKRTGAGQDFLSQLKLQSIRRNPWIDAGSQLASGAAGGIAGGGWGTAGTSGAGTASNFGSEAGTWYSNPSLWRT